ncbi:aspartate aminotransferase family protein [Nocardia sp. NPDC046473]|uniref:aspartate aminotransferase family protein n=1 Tax=Nocardia sp. NPDC046473 TaxID=3155733 RepID=UPI0033F5E133
MELPAAVTRPRKPEMVNGFSDDDLQRQPPHNRARIERRKGLLGPGYQLFYTDPVDVVRGQGVHLYDDEGNQYLDAYNNVASIGHCHPAVTYAVSRQLGILNTNTRYLQDQILDYSEDLLSTFPDELNRVTYTCTGSEANDLAIRIAQAHTGNAGIIVTANAYHGVTEAVASFSPSLGKTSPLGPHVRVIAAPDSSRHGSPDFAEFMRGQIRAAIADLNRHGFGLCAFIADSIFSSDGVFAHPTTVLGALAEEVHRAGGVYIADEVQSGFGRTGDAWWGFQRHQVVPDLVTMGKPMGNGIPVAATVLRNDIGRAFGENVRYFNTFGGSTVPIAAARAVYEVIRDEHLIDNAHLVGTYLLDELRRVTAARPEVFEVRGAGMFLGIDLVDPESGRPDGVLAKAIVDDMRRNFVLISASGPAANVLKIRPPLVFHRTDADRLLETLSRSFQRLLPQ